MAHSITLKRVVLLKASWRVVGLGPSDEDTIYSKLLSAEVPFISRILCAGNVSVDGEVQVTEIQVVAEDDSVVWKSPLSLSRTHLHHRVVQELALSLSTARNSREYTEALRDAFRGMSLCPSSFVHVDMNAIALGAAEEEDIHRQLGITSQVFESAIELGPKHALVVIGDVVSLEALR